MSSTQMLKGILEGCLLSIISKRESYGYELMELLKEYGLTMVKEGTLYPLLSRLKEEGLIKAKDKTLTSRGPQRRYYYLTEKGEEALYEFKNSWIAISNSVNELLDDTDR